MLILFDLSIRKYYGKASCTFASNGSFYSGYGSWWRL